ncbi:MAG: EAL domain-containing protein [Desulfobacteraceae bacterium]|nr:EAL domain-containing protein [Desulfobacteraceae bacterium]
MRLFEKSRGIVKRGRAKIFSKNSAIGIGLRLLVSIAATELAILIAFNLIGVEKWLPQLLVDLADTIILGGVASCLIVHWVVNPMKIIEERRKAEERLHFLAYHDSLTGLPNRVFFKELLGRTIEYAKRYGRKFAIAYVDLDEFERICDTLGHDAGDKLLQDASRRLVGTIRTSDDIARMSGEATEDIARTGEDEFAVLLNGLSSLQDAGRVADRILARLSEPFTLKDREIFLTAGIGISAYPDDGQDAEGLIENAVSAMYFAKRTGKNHYQYYTQSMNDAALKRLTMENDLHKALERNEFLIYYQPKIDLKTGKTAGMEALLRWRHPVSGLTMPSEFIPLAEASGLIVPIGKFVLQEACLQNKKWQDAGLEAVSVAVNISGRQFDQKDLTEVIFKTLNDTGLQPKHLEIEVTEGTIMKDPEGAIRVLKELKAAGVRIAVDDFGTGYSSLNYLRKLPLDALKIDISFTRNMFSSHNDEVIVKTIIAMAQNLNLKVIVEGVENKKQLEFFQEHECDEVQGFFFSKPLPSEEAAKFIKG